MTTKVFCSVCKGKCETCCKCIKGPSMSEIASNGGNVCMYFCRHGDMCWELLGKERIACKGKYCENDYLCLRHARSLDKNQLCMICRVESFKQEEIFHIPEHTCYYPECSNIGTEKCPGVLCHIETCTNWVCDDHILAFRQDDVGRICDDCCFSATR